MPSRDKYEPGRTSLTQEELRDLSADLENVRFIVTESSRGHGCLDTLWVGCYAHHNSAFIT